MPVKVSSKGSFGIRISNVGTWQTTTRALHKLRNLTFKTILEYYGVKGVDLLRDATPKDTGTTSESWNYEIHESEGQAEIVWTNTNTNKGISIVLLLQYGHATKDGGYILGYDFVNPAVERIFDELAVALWAEVTSI